jgi:hypothetical protein
MKKQILWILLGAVVLASAAFLFLNFRAAASNTRFQTLVTTTDMGEDIPAPIQRRDKISLVLVGKGALVGALKKALTQQLGEAGIGEIELVDELAPVYPNPVLVVKLVKPGAIWTPFFATSQFSVHAGYASDGDSTFMQGVEATHTSIGKAGVSNLYAEYDGTDRSFGLISRPGYQTYLADYLAGKIVTALKDLYK